MVTLILDLLTKRESEKIKIIYLFIRVFFTIIISTYLYKKTIGDYDIITISDYKALIEYVLNGQAFISLFFYILVWFISYELLMFLISIIIINITDKFYNIIYKIVSNIEDIEEEMKNNKSLQGLAKLYINIFDLIDVIEIKNEEINPGSTFYKFYDYLLEVEDNKKMMNNNNYKINIVLIIQFVFIYQAFNMDFLSKSILIEITTYCLIFLIFITSIIISALAELINVKHSRLIDIMEKIDPIYDKSKTQIDNKEVNVNYILK